MGSQIEIENNNPLASIFTPKEMSFIIRQLTKIGQMILELVVNHLPI
jgi:hypothetical protein